MSGGSSTSTAGSRDDQIPALPSQALLFYKDSDGVPTLRYRGGALLMMNQSWFEMADYRRRKFATAVWVPLRAIHVMHADGRQGHMGFRQDFFGAGSLAVAVGNKEKAVSLGWDDSGNLQKLPFPFSAR